MDDFDKIVGDSLRDGRLKTPKFVWDKIENEIESKQKKKKGIYLVLAAILIAGGSIVALLIATHWPLDKTSSLSPPDLDTLSATENEAAYSGESFERDRSQKYHGNNSVQNAMAKNHRVENLNDFQQRFTGKQFEGITGDGANFIPRKMNSSRTLVLDTHKLEAWPSRVIRNRIIFSDTDMVGKNQPITELVFSDADSIVEIVEHITHLASNDDLSKKENFENCQHSDSVDESTRKVGIGKFFVEVKGGNSAYKINLWDETFKVGGLTRRPFDAKGFNANLSVGYEFNRWINPIVGINYNVKSAGFTYSALYDDHGWLTHNIYGRNISIDEINDNDYLCNNHILSGISAQFKISSYTIDIGNKVHAVESRHFGLDLDLKYSLDLKSAVLLQQISKIDVSNHLKQTMMSRIAGGVNLYFNVSEHYKLFVYQEYIYGWQSKNNSLYQGNFHELISSLGIRVKI